MLLLAFSLLLLLLPLLLPAAAAAAALPLFLQPQLPLLPQWRLPQPLPLSLVLLKPLLLLVALLLSLLPFALGCCNHGDTANMPV